MKPEVSVIIPNWNGKKYLETCFNSLRNQNFKNFEIILVDNGSQDGSVEFIEKNYPEIKILALKQNTGFSKAVNLGIKKAQGKYIALLNNDTEAHPDWLKNLKLAAENYPQYYFFASKILCFDKRNIIDSAGDGIYITGKAYRRGHYQEDGPEFNKKQEVFGVCGAAAFYRKELFDKIGYFDEDFFAFYEDVDLNFRAQLAGLKCLYIPSAVVYHIGHGSSKDNYWVAFLCRRNELFTLIKNMPFRLCIKYFRKVIWFHFWWAFKDLIKISIRYKCDKITRVRTRARLIALKDFWKIYKKRQVIQKNRQINLKDLEFMINNID